jgi:hypothetical protein
MSTYSNLKIELITTGDQSGTWGATTNTNLGTAVEEAVVGAATVTFASADITLTLTNVNTTQTARNFVLNLTGTSGGARNLILGTGCQISKPYLIINGCADTVTVKNTTGTGVAVPAGTQAWVYNNATNVVSAINYIPSITLGAALPVASGGTGVTAPGTSGNVLTSNGTSWYSAAPAASGVTSVTASSPLASSGGTTPNITFAVAPGTVGNVLTSTGTSWVSSSSSAGVTTGKSITFALVFGI